MNLNQNQGRMLSENGEDIDSLSEIAELLLKEKCLTHNQIEYAGRVRSKLETPRSLLEVLKELKFITEDQIKETVRKNRLSMCIGNILTQDTSVVLVATPEANLLNLSDVNLAKMEIMLEDSQVSTHQN